MTSVRDAASGTSNAHGGLSNAKLSGVWSLSTQYQAKGDNNWNPPLAGDIGLFARSATLQLLILLILRQWKCSDFGDHSNDQVILKSLGE